MGVIVTKLVPSFGDNYGTMLEELVGEIHDEMDKGRHTVEEVEQGEILMNGVEELRTVEKYLAVYLSGRPTDSVNHWILNHVEHIPKAGERFVIDGLDVMVEEASRRRIQKVRLACSAVLEPDAKGSVPPND